MQFLLFNSSETLKEGAELTLEFPMSNVSCLEHCTPINTPQLELDSEAAQSCNNIEEHFDGSFPAQSLGVWLCVTCILKTGLKIFLIINWRWLKGSWKSSSKSLLCIVTDTYISMSNCQGTITAPVALHTPSYCTPVPLSRLKPWVHECWNKYIQIL